MKSIVLLKQRNLFIKEKIFVQIAANDNCHLRLVSNLTPANTQTLTYDVLNRLSTASGNYGSLSYGYDGNNNRTSQTFSGTGTTFSYQAWYGGAGDRLHQGVTGAVTQSVSNTGAGNTSNISPALPSGVSVVNYNYAEQMANVTNGTSTIASYTYDGFGRRASKTVSGVTTYYVYAPDGTLLEEANGSGAVQVDYAYLPEYSFLPNSSYLGGRPIGEYSPVSKHLYYLHTDRLGAPIAATDHAGVTQWQATYQPFGLANITTSAITQDLRLPGQYYDAETGFHHNGAREYMPGGPAGTPGVPGGRYVQMDPLFLAGNRFDAGNPNAVIGGLNPFVYAGANPGTWVDPLGLKDNAPNSNGPAANCPKDCEEQAQADEAVCRTIPDASVRARCWESANERYGACKANRPLPPLVTQKDNSPAPNYSNPQQSTTPPIVPPLPVPSGGGGGGSGGGDPYEPPFGHFPGMEPTVPQI